jgi:hypothetical protein
MLELFTNLFESISNFFQFIYDFFAEGIYDFAVWAFAKFIEYSTKAFLEFAIWSLPFAWNTAKQIIIDLDLSSMINSAWSQLGSNTQGLATMLRIPECVNVLLSGAVTKYVLRFVPFL